MLMKSFRFSPWVVGLVLAPGIALAQRTVPANPAGIPVAPTGLQQQPFPAARSTWRTGEGQDIEVSVLARLRLPYSIAFLPSGDLLAAQRTGEITLVPRGGGAPQPVTGGPASVFAGTSGGLGAVHGYMSLAVHPRYAQNGYVYFSYTKPLPENRRTVAVARARLAGAKLTEVRDVWVGEGVGGAVAIALTPDAKLWIGTGGNEPAQDPSLLAGKVLRLNDDGTVPQDNPFVGKAGYRPEIYTMGHRSTLGLAVHPATGEVYLSEMGPNGGDEINLLKPGRNYGWPVVSLGRTYPGPWQAEANEPTHHGFELPLVYWTPSISVSGLTFYNGDALPKWKGDLFVGGLRYGEIPGTGRLDRIVLSEKLQELRRESLLTELHQRIRDVKQGPDGLLYVATDEEDGAILRIGPAH
jgi:glucose/arabinose dehydrogenase